MGSSGQRSYHTRPIYLSIINYIVTTSNNLLSAITMQHNGRRSLQDLLSSRKIPLVQLSLVKIADGYLTINLNLTIITMRNLQENITYLLINKQQLFFAFPFI